MSTSKYIEVAPGRYLHPDAAQFTFTRSGGPGGQHVNKTSTAVTLTVALNELARILPADAVHRLKAAAGHRLAGDRLMIRASNSRSQSANRKACLLKLRYMVEQSLDRPKLRRKRQPSKRAIRKRVETKRLHGRRKADRRGSDSDW